MEELKEIKTALIVEAFAATLQDTVEEFCRKRRRVDGVLRMTQITCWKVLTQPERSDKVTLGKLAEMFNKANHTSIIQGVQVYDDLHETDRNFRRFSADMISEVIQYIKSNEESESEQAGKPGDKGGIPEDTGRDNGNSVGRPLTPANGGKADPNGKDH